MSKSKPKPDNRLARELLQLYDDLTALNGCTAFVLDALAEALMRASGADSLSAEGAMFCVQWLNDRTIEIERRLKAIQRKVHAAAHSKSHVY